MGKVAGGRQDIDGDPIVAVTASNVPDGSLSGLRVEGISYALMGEARIGLGSALASNLKINACMLKAAPSMEAR